LKNDSKKQNGGEKTSPFEKMIFCLIIYLDS